MASHTKLTISHINNVQLGAEEEAKGNLQQAAKYYEEAIKDERPDELPFNRLMVIYRKLKQFKDELRVIKLGIRRFEEFYKRQSKSARGKLSQLSEAFMKTSGLKDRKGKNLYNPEPIGKWMNRLEMVEKKRESESQAQGQTQTPQTLKLVGLIHSPPKGGVMYSSL